MSNPFHKFDRMLGKKPNPQRMFRDSDGDKVPNVFDCEPNNKNKQGITHRIARTVAKKVTRGKLRKETMAAIDRREELADARTEAKQKEDLRFVKERETIRTERKLKYERQGGFSGALSRAIQSQAKALPPRRKRGSVQKKKGRKKGKKRPAQFAEPEPFSIF